MRKSSYVTLLLASAAAVSLAGCDQNTMTGKDAEADATVYGDAAACSKDFDAATCDQALDAAKTEHAQQAPKFATAAECEAAGYAKCEAAPPKTGEAGSFSGGGMFMPMMMGYMMGRTLGGGGFGGMGGGGGGIPPQADQRSAGTTSAGASAGSASGGGAVGGGAGARPVYADRNGYMYAGGGTVGRVAPGTTSLGSTSAPARVTARGGFGGSAQRFSGGS